MAAAAGPVEKIPPVRRRVAVEAPFLALAAVVVDNMGMKLVSPVLPVGRGAVISRAAAEPVVVLARRVPPEVTMRGVAAMAAGAVVALGMAARADHQAGPVGGTGEMAGLPEMALGARSASGRFRRSGCGLFAG